MRFSIIDVSTSKRTSSPFDITSYASELITIGIQLFIALRKKMLANDLAIIPPTPASLRIRGAFSRLEPHPKFYPTNKISPSLTFLVKFGSNSTKAYFLLPLLFLFLLILLGDV